MHLKHLLASPMTWVQFPHRGRRKGIREVVLWPLPHKPQQVHTHTHIIYTKKLKMAKSTLLQDPLWESSPTPQNSSRVPEQLNSTGLTQEKWEHSCIRRLVYGVHSAIPAKRWEDDPPVQSRYVKCGLWRELNATLSCNKKQHNNGGLDRNSLRRVKEPDTEAMH